MKGHRKSYFSALREKQILERVNSDRGKMGQNRFEVVSAAAIRPSTSTSSSSIRFTEDSLYSRGGDDEDDDDDMWSFKGRTSSMQINIAPARSPPHPPARSSSPPPPQESNVLLDPELEALIQLPLPSKNSRLRKFINLDREDQSTSAEKKALSSISDKFRKLKETPPAIPRRSLPNRKTPEKRRSSTSKSRATTHAPPEEDEVNRLESSIVVESSPIRTPKLKNKRRKSWRRFLTPTSSPSRNKRASSTVDDCGDYYGASQRISQVASQISSAEHLSGQISEVTSSQSLTSSPVRTPMSMWIHQDTSTSFHVGRRRQAKGQRTIIEEIEHPESPRRDPEASSSQPEISGSSDSEAPSPEVPSLLQNFMAIKARYDSSVRLFAHDYRNGKFDDATALHLFIRKVAMSDPKDKMVQTLAYDLKAKQDRWVLFRPADMLEIIEGVFLKIFPPWQEIPISGTTETMIIGTDFYKVVQRSKVIITDQRLKKILDLPAPNSWDTRVPETLFLDLVPYHIKNKNTIRNHVTRFHSYLDIDIVVLQAWTQISPALFLVKDSDDFLSFLQVPEENLEIIGTLSGGGKYFKLRQIAFLEKISISQKLAPFSVLCLFGTRDKYFYTFKWSSINSKCISENDLDISLNEMGKGLKIIDEIYEVSAVKDHRISLKCRLKEKDECELLVTDDESDRSLRIQFVSDPDFVMKELPLETGATLMLKFLRLVHGKAIWDCYTIWEAVPDDDDGDGSVNDACLAIN